MMPFPRVAVIGGGIAGLSAARALAAQRDPPVDVVVLEASDRVGGKILTERTGGFTIEAGPDSFLTTKTAAVDLCREIGLGAGLTGPRPGGRTVYVLHRGRLYRVPEGLALVVPLQVLPLVRTGLFSPLEKARMALDLLIPPRAAEADEAVGSLVARRLGRAVVDRLAAPLLGGIYAGDVDQLSVQATFPQLAEMERRDGGLILGMLARPRDGTAPVRERLPLFMTLAGGLDTLVDRLAAWPGVTVRTRTPVRAITQIADGDAIRDDPIRCRDRGAPGTSRLGRPAPGRYLLQLDRDVLGADAIVLAAPAFVAADLLHALCPAAAASLRQITHVSTAVVALGYRSADIPTPLDGHGFVVARGEDSRITACTWVSAKWDGRAPEGYAQIRCYLGRAGDEAALDLDDGEMVTLVRREMERILGIAAPPVLTRVYRWKQAMPQYLVGHLGRIEGIERALAEAAPGIALAGAAYRGTGIPDCIRQGIEAATRALDHLRARRTTN